MKYSPDEYLSLNLFDGDESDVQCRSIRLLKVRKEHTCFLSMDQTEQHMISKGETARLEKGLIDRSFWGSYYCCVPCMDRFIDELYGEEDESA